MSIIIAVLHVPLCTGAADFDRLRPMSEAGQLQSIPSWSNSDRGPQARRGGLLCRHRKCADRTAWTVLLNERVDWPAWSRDGRTLFFECVDGQDHCVCRCTPAMRARRNSIDPAGNPLLLRDAGDLQIFALEWPCAGSLLPAGEKRANFNMSIGSPAQRVRSLMRDDPTDGKLAAARRDWR